MASLRIRELDLGDTEDLLQHEQGMYQAFSPFPQRIFDNLWVFDHAQKRVRTIVPYSGQRVVAAEVDGQLIGGAMLNLDMESQLQIEKIGFSVPKVQGKTAEGLALFANQLIIDGELVMVEIMRFADSLLESLGIKTFWASCDESLVPGYLNFGFRNIDTLWFNGQDEFLLERKVGSRIA